MRQTADVCAQRRHHLCGKTRTICRKKIRSTPQCSFTTTYEKSRTKRESAIFPYTIAQHQQGFRPHVEQQVRYAQVGQEAPFAGKHLIILRQTETGQLRQRAARLGQWTEIVRTYEVRKRVGEANEAAVAQALANKLSVEGSVLTLRKQIRAQENSLSALLGRVPGPVSRTTLGEQRFPEKLAVGVPLQLLERRPDVRQAEAALAQAFYNTNAACSAFYPRITLSGSAGWTNNSGSAIINPGNWLLSALGSLTQPSSSAGRTSPTCVSPRHARKRPCSPSAKACSGQATR